MLFLIVEIINNLMMFIQIDDHVGFGLVIVCVLHIIMHSNEKKKEKEVILGHSQSRRMPCTYVRLQVGKYLTYHIRKPYLIEKPVTSDKTK